MAASGRDRSGEQARLAALHDLGILDTPREPCFDRMVALAADALGIPIAQISLVDAGRQWIKACIGLEITETKRDVAFCSQVILSDRVLVVPDAPEDPRFRDGPFVTGPPHIRFYAGAPLKSRDGHRVGSLCVADFRRRDDFGPEQIELLRGFAETTSDLLHLRRWQTTAAGELAERETIERQLRNSERRTRLIIHESGEGFVSIDGESRIHEWNRRAEQIFGWGRDEIIGRRLTETIIPPQSRDAHRAGLAHFMETGEGDVLFRPVELTALHRDGHEFPVEVNAWPVQVGEESTFHAFVRDITERKRAEEAITRAKEAAEAADRAKSEFLSRMSHELRTPLNAILGFSQLLEMDDLTDEQMDSLGEIRKGGRHLLSLINEVLDIARIESGRLSLSIEPVYLVDIVHQAVGLMRSLAAGAHVSVETEEVSLRRFVSGDHQRLNQVLLNLLSNAIKYNEHGGKVVIGAREIDGLVHVDVTDTGKGIDPSRMDQLFTPFDRLGAEQTLVEGSGLGLALSRTLVNAMGGEISASRGDDGGMTFTVVLPATSSQLTELEVDAAEPQEIPVVKLSARYTILYIEDNLSNLKLIEQTLGKDADLQLLTAIQGGMGLQLAREHHPDLILLDLHLPDIPGAAVLRQLIEDPRTETIPVVIVSADATKRQVARLLTAGARAYVTKPLDLVELRTVVGRILGGDVPAGGDDGRGDVTTSS